MISNNCFNSKWLRDRAREIDAKDPGVFEKTVHAFALLCNLVESGLDFVFKGGTSVLLHVPVIHRLSIDVDILCAESPDKLKMALNAIATKPPFVGYKEEERGHRGLPKRRHFRFFYPPSIGDSILLDVVEEQDVPHTIVAKSINVPFLEMEREVIVHLPTPESLLADKLAAFAPKTIGVLYEPPNHKPDPMQIAKQLFDVGELFDVAKNLAEVRATYQKIFELENGYRGGMHNMTEALHDTLLASLSLSQHGFKNVPTNKDILVLEDGRKRMLSHLVNCVFNLDDARQTAAKAGLLASLMLAPEVNQSLAHYNTVPDLKDVQPLSITGEWQKLNKLKSTKPSAFYYWYQASKLVS